MTEQVPDLALFSPAQPPPRSRVMRRHIDATIDRARGDGALPPGDGIEVGMLRDLADRLDRVRQDAETKAAYAEAALMRELRETLTMLGLTGGRQASPMEAVLAALTADDDDDAA